MKPVAAAQRVLSGKPGAGDAQQLARYVLGMQPQPDEDYTALMAAGMKQHNYRQGTGACTAFERGAEWVRLHLRGSIRLEPMAGESKQKKLFDLANRIDPEKLWQRAGMDRPGFSDDQKDRLDAGVNLRRYANLLQPDRWLLIPPSGSVQFSSASLDGVYEMAWRDVDRQKGMS